MNRILLSFALCAAVVAHAALADDLLPVPPGANAAPTQPAAPAAGQMAPAHGSSQQSLAEARAACDADIQTLCPGVQPGGGRILACLKQHKEQVAPGCKQAVAKALKDSN